VGVTFEKLRVYQVAVLLDEMVNILVAGIPRGHSRDVDQLRRASASIGHNIAEANGCDEGRKILHLQIARGSADETRSVLRRLARCRALTQQSICKPCGLAVAIAKMLTSWIEAIS
jgi:four helix bundle protein